MNRRFLLLIGAASGIIVVLTQNALADGTYFEYLRFLYGDQLTLPTQDDSQRAFQDYMADAQAGLLADHGFTAQAKEAYQLATDIGPSNQEVVLRYVNFLSGQKRFSEAIPGLETAANAAPDNQQLRDLLQSLKRAAGRN
jgi:predicted Zn-dependent protease